jgi:hypothetical protein
MAKVNFSIISLRSTELATIVFALQIQVASSKLQNKPRKNACLSTSVFSWYTRQDIASELAPPFIHEKM